MATTSRRKPQARPAPRPAPDHGQDPAGGPPATDTTRAGKQARSTTTPRTKATGPGTDAAEEDGTRFPARITLPLTDDADMALKQARLQDKIPAVGRIRAMIDLWQTNERFRAQVDRHAQHSR